LVTPLGTGVDQNWTLLCDGVSGIGPITHFDASSLKCRLAGEVKDFNPLDFMDQKFIGHFDPFMQFAMAAAVQAAHDAGLETAGHDKYRMGVVIGTAFGSNTFFERSHTFVVNNNLKKVPPFFVINNSGNLVAGNIAIRFGAKGPNHCAMEACASGTNAIGMAFRLIQWGEADVMIAGGSDAGIIATNVASTDLLGALSSKRNNEPSKASRPFDADRDGFVFGEGSGVVILESLESAEKRGAKIYAEVIGYGNNCDAHHITSPSPGGEVQGYCISLALQDAGLAPEQVDYINAHGTATVLNDVSETKAIKRALGNHALKVAISSNKSMIGHMCGAAGAVESVFTILTIMNNIIPPTINFDNPDPQCDLDYVPNLARRSRVSVALSNSFGFGGINGTLAFKKFEG
jgi:3-oxoacyl-[acyl-carrier-protein] synthase II